MNRILILQILFLGNYWVSAQQRVVGGSNATEETAPYQVSIRSYQLQHYCGGSILNKDWVITSPICSRLDALVAAGSIYLDRINLLVGVAKNFIDADNKIGLLKVTTPFTFSNLIQPINLPSENIGAGVPLRVTGWGCNSTRFGDSLNNILQVLVTYTIPIEICQNFAAISVSYETSVCTFLSLNQGACRGDEGTPFVNQNELHAINYSPSFGMFLYPDINVRVFTYKSWILSVMAAN